MHKHLQSAQAPSWSLIAACFENVSTHAGLNQYTWLSQLKLFTN